MAFETYLRSKETFVFGLDNVIYPVKDYHLQIYYLFSGFMEYTEMMNAKSLLDFMQLTYATEGETGIFEKTARAFNIDFKYKENFDRLFETAMLPLKLLPYQQVLTFLQAIVTERKPVYLLAPGDPQVQLNKIKQLEWYGLETYLKVYFTDEIAEMPSAAIFEFLQQENRFKAEDTLYVGNALSAQQLAQHAGIEFLPVYKLL